MVFDVCVNYGDIVFDYIEFEGKFNDLVSYYSVFFYVCYMLIEDIEVYVGLEW